MLNRLQPQSPDALLALIKMYADDPRSEKIDLGVGVYRTDDGATPVFAAVKAAEAKLLQDQDSKSYLGPEGDMGFVHALVPYIFGEAATHGGRIEGMQTPGGTGACRLAFALAQRAGVDRVHMGTPSWPNHAQILADVGLAIEPFEHADASGRANVEPVLDAIRAGREGDAVLLHGCCHNPTGIDYSADQWDALAAALADSPVLPILDAAYQGLGEGMEADIAGLRKVLAAVPNALIAYSCDKNFGQYRDRVGAFYMLTQSAEQTAIAVSNANALARANWSMPPDHGGATVRVLLRDPDLVDQWVAELDTMRARLRSVREALANAGQVGSLDLRPLGKQNGMFAILTLTKDQIKSLREDHAVYMAGSGRINIAGLHSGNIAKFIDALRAVAG